MTTPDAPDDAHGMDQQNTSHSQDSQDSPDPPGTPDAGTRSGAKADSAGGEPFGAAPGAPLDDVFGESMDELALRALMRDAVRGLEASPDALDHLRRAIPARRQHRRQALAGAAAALLLAGMAVPALMRATNTSNTSSAAPVGVASAHAAVPDEDGHTHGWGVSSGPSGHASPEPGGGPKQQPPTTGATVGPSTAAISPTDTDVPVIPDCAGTQLGQGASQADAPDADGLVYGWFRVANVSDTACTVPSGGVVQAVAQGSADASRIQVVDHSAGDAATGLPATTSSGPIVLKPGEDYEVAFAWVPAADGPGGCPTPTTPPTTPTPTDTPTDPGTSPGTGDSTGSTGSEVPQSGTDDTPVTPDPGSVVLNHTPAAGAPVVDGPVIQGACAGTVYTTTAMPAPTDTSGS